MTEQLALDELRYAALKLPRGMVGRPRPAISEAEVAPCECPELCLRDHENE